MFGFIKVKAALVKSESLRNFTAKTQYSDFIGNYPANSKLIHWFPSMSLLEKNQETDQKHGRDAELSMNSPEIQAFFNLVDREAHRFALLNGKNQLPEMPVMENRIVWQPSFIMEDFNIPWNGNSNACRTGKSTDPIQPLTNDGDGGLGEGKEERLKMGSKRERDAFALASNGSQERMKKKTPSNGIICDLNKPDESLDLWSLV